MSSAVDGGEWTVAEIEKHLMSDDNTGAAWNPSPHEMNTSAAVGEGNLNFYSPGNNNEDDRAMFFNVEAAAQYEDPRLMGGWSDDNNGGQILYPPQSFLPNLVHVADKDEDERRMGCNIDTSVDETVDFAQLVEDILNSNDESDGHQDPLLDVNPYSCY